MASRSAPMRAADQRDSVSAERSLPFQRVFANSTCSVQCHGAARAQFDCSWFNGDCQLRRSARGARNDRIRRRRMGARRKGHAARQGTLGGHVVHGPGLPALDRPTTASGERGTGGLAHRSRADVKHRSGPSRRRCLQPIDEPGPLAERGQLLACHAETRRALDVCAALGSRHCAGLGRQGRSDRRRESVEGRGRDLREESEAPVVFEGTERLGTTFVLGSAVPHPHQLHLGDYSVHTPRHLRQVNVTFANSSRSSTPQVIGARDRGRRPVFRG